MKAKTCTIISVSVGMVGTHLASKQKRSREPIFSTGSALENYGLTVMETILSQKEGFHSKETCHVPCQCTGEHI